MTCCVISGRSPALSGLWRSPPRLCHRIKEILRSLSALMITLFSITVVKGGLPLTMTQVFFFKEVSRQWSERFVWIFSSAFPSLIWDQQGCSLKSWFPRLLMSCRWLSKRSCDRSFINLHDIFANTQVEVLKSFWLIYVCKIWQVHSRSLFRVKGWPCLL